MTIASLVAAVLFCSVVVLISLSLMVVGQAGAHRVILRAALGAMIAYVAFMAWMVR